MTPLLCGISQYQHYSWYAKVNVEKMVTKTKQKKSKNWKHTLTHSLALTHTQHFYIYWFKVLEPLTYIYRRMNSWFSRLFLLLFFHSFTRFIFSICVPSRRCHGVAMATPCWLMFQFQWISRTSRRKLNWPEKRAEWNPIESLSVRSNRDHISGLKDSYGKKVYNSICTNARLPHSRQKARSRVILIFSSTVDRSLFHSP